MKRLPLVLVAVVGLAFVAGCGTVRSTIDTVRALDRAGYANPGVSFDTVNGFDTVVVSGSGGPIEDPEGRAAEIVWTTFKFKFDQVDVRVNGGRKIFSRGELIERFGPRPRGSDKDLGTDVVKTLAVVAALGFVFLGVVALIIVLVVRSSRRKRPPQPPMWYPPPQQQPPQSSDAGPPPPWRQ